jgi:hypothetical protein
VNRSAVRATRRRVAAALIVAMSLAACGSEDTAPAAASTSTTPPPPPPPPPVYWPLTGLESGEVPARPALAVKIENSVDARPQTGLNSADIVWEQVVEGGITRFVAVYHSTVPAEVGPVRSLRPMDAAIAGPLDGLMAFAGGLRPFVDAATAEGLQVLGDEGSGFYRVKTRYAPHNLYADPAKLLARADAAHQTAPAAQFTVAAPDQQSTAVVAGAPAAALTLKLSGVSHPRWTWDPAGQWLRAEGNTPAVEADGTPLRAANVVVLRVTVVNTPFRDPAGNPVPETQMVGTGEALVATGGRTLAATWTKNSAGEPVALTGADGQPVLLAPGNTWVELVPTRTGSVTVG